MKICISGLSASGKTTVGRRLAKYLGIRHVSMSYKRDAKNNTELMEPLKNPKRGYARSFDKAVVSMAKGDCVVTTWLSPWMVKNPTLNVRLYADPEERARRIMKREGTSHAKAVRYIKEKDHLTIAHFKKTYGIDVTDDSKFDMEINTGKISTEKAVAVIALAAMLKEGKRFE